MTTVVKTPFWFTSEFEGEEILHYCNSHSELMNAVVRCITFGDLSDEKVLEIESEGESIHYVGWQPDMHYVFKNEQGDIVWDNYYPEYDH